MHRSNRCDEIIRLIDEALDAFGQDTSALDEGRAGRGRRASASRSAATAA